MADFLSVFDRSERMSRIRGRGNKTTEIRFMALLKRNGITGWRRHYPIQGRPDFAFPKLRVAVFIDGVFWHGHPKYGHIPSTRSEFWSEKISRNKARDKRVNQLLKARGWIVLRIWENELALKKESQLLRRILPKLGVQKVNLR